MASQARPRQCRTVSPSHQVRRWRSCYRWAALALPAHALLVVAAVTNTLASKHLSGWSRRPAPRFSILLAALLARPVGHLGPGCAGRSGGADSRHTPAAAAW
jgi:hypothetical protein